MLFLLVLWAFFSVNAMNNQMTQSDSSTFKKAWIEQLETMSTSITEQTIFKFRDMSDGKELSSCDYNLVNLEERKLSFLKFARGADENNFTKQLDGLTYIFADRLHEIFVLFHKMPMSAGCKFNILQSLFMLKTCTLERIMCHPGFIRKYQMSEEDLLEPLGIQQTYNDPIKVIDLYLKNEENIASFLALLVNKTFTPITDKQLHDEKLAQINKCILTRINKIAQQEAAHKEKYQASQNN